MTHSQYAHIVVYALIIICAIGALMMVGIVYHYINKYVFIPMLTKVAQWRDRTRAMDTTSARYHKVIR